MASPTQGSPSPQSLRHILCHNPFTGFVVHCMAGSVPVEGLGLSLRPNPTLVSPTGDDFDARMWIGAPESQQEKIQKSSIT